MSNSLLIQKSAVSVLGILVAPAVLAAIISTLFITPYPDNGATDAGEVLERIRPVAQVHVAGVEPVVAQATVATAATVAPTPGSGQARSAEDVYQATCLPCHGTGVAGAPLFADKAAWAPRAEKGMATLLDSVIKGKELMPPRAGNPSLTDAELKSAIEYMLEKAGLSAG